MKDAFGNEFKDTADTMNPSIRSATLSAHSAIDSAAAKAKPVLVAAATKAHDATDKTAEWLNEKSDQLAQTQEKLTGNVTSYVTSNPMKALGMAIVAGAVLARIL